MSKSIPGHSTVHHYTESDQMSLRAEEVHLRSSSAPMGLHGPSTVLNWTNASHSIIGRWKQATSLPAHLGPDSTQIKCNLKRIVNFFGNSVFVLVERNSPTQVTEYRLQSYTLYIFNFFINIICCSFSKHIPDLDILRACNCVLLHLRRSGLC